MTLSRILLGCLLLLFAGTAMAQGPERKAGRWVQDHLAVDTAAVGGWRAGWEDAEAGGFQVVMGGGELNIGLDFASGFYGFFVGARALAGSEILSQQRDTAGQGGRLYVEALGQVGGQVRLADAVRLQAGVALGQLWLDEQSGGFLAGGFLRLGVDWLARDVFLLRALSVWLRLDIDGHIDRTNDIPKSSLGLALGIGLRL